MKVCELISIFICALFLGCSEKSNNSITSSDNDATKDVVNTTSISEEQVLKLEQKINALEQEKNTLTKANQLQVSKLEELRLALQKTPTNAAAPDKIKMEQTISQQKDLLIKYAKAINDQKTEIFRLRKLASTKPATPAGQAKPGLVTRTQFKTAFLGKPSATLLRWSKPDSTSDTLGLVFWYYKNKTYDPISGKTDFNVQVQIESGRVTGINF